MDNDVKGSNTITGVEKLATEVLATEALDLIVTESGYLIYVTDEDGNVNGIMNNENK